MEFEEKILPALSLVLRSKPRKTTSLHISGVVAFMGVGDENRTAFLYSNKKEGDLDVKEKRSPRTREGTIL